MKEYYDSIFKRKSFHLFRERELLSQSELQNLKEFIKTVKPLNENIQTTIEIVPESETTCKRGAEYCIVFYSENKEDSLRNIGYMGEQIDLYLAQNDIGALWFGIGKPKESKMKNLDFIIMILIGKMVPDKFRKDMFKAKRKPLDEMFKGDSLVFSPVIRFAPSACNLQPWIVEHIDDTLLVYRYKDPNRRGIMPLHKVTYYNRIDMGILLCFIEICLEHFNINFEKVLEKDESDENEKALNATYKIIV